MPGLTYKNPEEAKLIREMYIKYLQGNNTIILLVISGTSDFTSSEAISIIKENCKDYLERTYLILTKADISAQIDKNLQDKVINNPLELRFKPFVVRHRNQEELDNKMAFEEAIKKEINVLSQIQFSRIPRENKGTLCLIKKLVKLQKEILINNKNDLFTNLQKELINIKTDLKKMPKSYSTDEEKYFLMLSYFREISEKLKESLKGSNKLLDNFNSNFNKNLKSNYTYYKNNFMNLIIDFLTIEFYEKINKEFDENTTLTLPNLFENVNFQKYILEEIEKTEKSTYVLVDNVKSLCLNLLKKIIEDVIKKNFRLKYKIINLITTNIEKKKDEVYFFINTLYILKKDKLYTLDDSYIKTINKIKDFIEKIKTVRNYCYNRNKPKYINSILIYCEFLENLNLFSNKDSIKNLQRSYNLEIMFSCFSYSNLIKKRFVDYVMRIIMNKFVFYYRDNIIEIFENNFSPLDKENLDLIEEDESIEMERKLLNIRINNIKNSIDKLNKVK